MLKRLLFACFLFLLCGGLVGAADPALPKTVAQLQSGMRTTVVCFGDSVTGVYYHTGGRRAYTDMLGIALRRAYPQADVQMVNAGISGHTTQNGLERLERDVLRHRPTLVTIMFGLNDMTRVPLEQYRQNLATLISKCRDSGAEVLLCTPNNVISTPGRPTEKLETYCATLRDLAREQEVPVADCYAELERERLRAPQAWRLLLSDEIHPNMDGHQRLAEILAKAISGKNISLADVAPASPTLLKTPASLREGKPVRVLAMPPYDAWIAEALQQLNPAAKVEVIPWPTADLTLSQLEQDAKKRVRTLKPDLVVIAVPRTAEAPTWEQFVHSYSWIMNWSLSFGHQEWDCLVIHPSVTSPESAPQDKDELVRQLVAAQDLSLIDRPQNDRRPAQEILMEAIRK